MFRVFCLFLVSLLPAGACKWDRDTLKEEAKGSLDTVKAITGWFDRYPARYYEMRLERVAKELEGNPGQLDLYDDAGVASDRLGRFDEAITWMERKVARIQALPATETSEHRYRYLANLGSFYMDRWISRKPDVRNADLEDLRAAEKLISDAIELNPDAHFGRERYQLQMIRWLLKDGPPEASEWPSFLEPREVREANFRKAGPDEVAGLTGLILLGEGWMSTDVFCSLRSALEESGLASVAQLAYGRSVELEGLGRGSLHPLAAVREEMKSGPSPHLEGARQVSINEFFKRARNAAEARRADWLAYQSVRFDRGMHPDTHPDFWNEWKEPEIPPFPGLTIGEWVKLNSGVVIMAVLALLACGLVGLCVFIKRQVMVAFRAPKARPST